MPIQKPQEATAWGTPLDKTVDNGILSHLANLSYNICIRGIRNVVKCHDDMSTRINTTNPHTCDTATISMPGHISVTIILSILI